MVHVLPFITWPLPRTNLKGWLRSLELSNTLPSVSLPATVQWFSRQNKKNKMNENTYKHEVMKESLVNITAIK